MKKFNTAKLLFGFLGLSTFASLVGTVSGTLAWYAYNNRVTVSYSGTSIENTVQLQVGIAAANPMPHDDTNPDNVEFWSIMTYEHLPNDDTYYYFAPLGVGLTSSVINAYLSANNYATNILRPATTGYYDPDDPLCSFSLKKSPTSNYYKQDRAADTNDYIKLPLVFRASRSKTEATDFIAGQELWLTDAKAVASSSNDGEICNSMRIFFDRNDVDYATDFIVNPNAPGDAAGETKVGGLLDLTDDKYYDFDNNGEIIYGEWDEDLLPDPHTLLSDSGYVVPDGQSNKVIDMNRTGADLNDADANTFCARHHQGVKYYTYDKLNDIPFKTAKYESLGSVKPIRSATNGTLTNANPAKPTSVCITGNQNDNYLGRVDATIWLEGWDYSVVDEEIAHAFDLGLTFEINKIGANSQI